MVKDARERFGISAGELRAFRVLDPRYEAEWVAAREASADALYDEAMTVARGPAGRPALDDDGNVVLDKRGEPVIIPFDAAHARTHIDTLKWAARIRNPRLYGDKQTLDVNVKTVDMTRIIQDAQKRLAAARQIGRVVEGAVITSALPSKLEDIL